MRSCRPAHRDQEPRNQRPRPLRATSPHAHLPLGTSDGDRGAGSQRQRAASWDESLCHAEQGCARTTGPRGWGQSAGRGRSRVVGPSGAGRAGTFQEPVAAALPLAAPCALRAPTPALLPPPHPPRAAAAAARPPATLPLPLNSCAKYAALYLFGGSLAAPGNHARETRRPLAPPALSHPGPPSIPLPQCRALEPA